MGWLEGVGKTMFTAGAWAKKENRKIQSQNFPRDRQKWPFLARLTPKIEKIPVRRVLQKWGKERPPQPGGLFFGKSEVREEEKEGQRRGTGPKEAENRLDVRCWLEKKTRRERVIGQRAESRGESNSPGRGKGEGGHGEADLTFCCFSRRRMRTSQCLRL